MDNLVKKKVILALALLFTFPSLAFAQGDIFYVIDRLGFLVNRLIPIAIGIAVLAFFWGVAVYIFKAGDEDAKDRGKRVMVGGIIGLFVILAIWGILWFIGLSLGIGVGEDITDIPTINDSNFRR